MRVKTGWAYTERMRARTISLVTSVLACCWALPAPAADASRPLWADLTPGPYSVGFRTLFSFDRSRTWKVTRGYTRPFAADPVGRPVRISVWYPAGGSAGATRMRYGAYVDIKAPPEFAAYNAIVTARDLLISGLNVPKGSLPALLETPVNAQADATPASGRFPLILYCGGLGAATVDNITLAEVLASYGFVVATVPMFGPSEVETGQVRNQIDIETTVRDLEFAAAFLQSLPDVDPAKLGVVGHSLGAVDAVLFGMRNQNVSAVVGLDGTYGFRGATTVLTGFYGFDLKQMHAALLDLRRTETKIGPSAFELDLSAVRSLHYAERTYVGLPTMFHADFTEFGVLARTFGFPPFADPNGRTYETAYRGYQSAVKITLAFLQANVNSEQQAAKRLRHEVSVLPGASFAHEPALAPAPNAEELLAIARDRGLAAALAIVDRYQREAPGDTIVGEAAYNAQGYDLSARARHADAINALLIAIHVHPASANLADTLGDIYRAAGRPGDSRKAYLHALELLPNDPGQNDAGKAELKAEIEGALRQLPP